MYSPQGVACCAEGALQGGKANFQVRITNSGAAQTSQPEKMFRRILRKEHRQAVGMHYGPTRINQTGFSPRLRRDGRVGTTILQPTSAFYEPKHYSVTTGRQGLLEHGQATQPRMAMQEYTKASGRINHATFRERADASVICAGF
jgi:hypothetical protein